MWLLCRGLLASAMSGHCFCDSTKQKYNRVQVLGKQSIHETILLLSFRLLSLFLNKKVQSVKTALVKKGCLLQHPYLPCHCLCNWLYNFYSHSQSLNNSVEHTCSRFNNTFLYFRNVGFVCSYSLC